MIYCFAIAILFCYSWNSVSLSLSLCMFVYVSQCFQLLHSSFLHTPVPHLRSKAGLCITVSPLAEVITLDEKFSSRERKTQSNA